MKTALLPFLLFSWLCCCHQVHGSFPLAILAPITSWSHEYLAAAVAFDLDFRKNADPGLVARFGPPIIEVPDLSENLTLNVSISDINSDLINVFHTLMKIFEGGTRGLIGLTHSTTAVSATPLCEFYKVPVVSYWATSADLSDKAVHPYFLRTIPSDTLQGRAMWRFLQQCSIRSAAFIYSLEPYGEGLFQAVASRVAIGSSAFTVVACAIPFETGTLNVAETKIIIASAMESVTKVVFVALTPVQAVLFVPIAKQEGLFSTNFQVVGSESVQLAVGQTLLPDGYMYFAPITHGSRFAGLQSLWQGLTPDDIYTSSAASRYFSRADELADIAADENVLTQESFSATGITESSVPLLFDAAYSVVFALNKLMKTGSSLDEISGEALLTTLRKVSFEGVSGQIEFDSNGDRSTAYHVMNVQGGIAVEAALYSLSDDNISLMDGVDLLWTQGSRGLRIPTAFIDCEPLFFLNSGALCEACPTGQVATADKRVCEACPTNTVALSDGTCGYNPLKLGVIGPFTAISMDYLACAVMFDLDFRKNFESDLVSQFGPPIIAIEDLNPALRVSLQLGNTDAQPEVGMATALELFQGQNGREAIAGLIGGEFSSVTMPVASLATQFKVPHIAYGATSAKLSSKDEYPYFLRTIPPDSIQSAAHWRFIKHFSVGSVTYLYDGESYAEGLYQVVSNLAAKAGESYRIEAVTVAYMPSNYNVSKAKEAISQVKSMSSKVIFLAMTSDQGRYFLAVAETEGLYCSTCQVIGSEALTYTFLYGNVPLGYMWFAPVNQGELYSDFQAMWTKMYADNVTNAEARSNYGIDLFEVGLDDGVVGALTDEAFDSADSLMDSVPFIFDACYSFVFAANALLNNGTEMEDIVGDMLLAALHLTDFTGISGRVTFDESGDRLASYYIWNTQPIDGDERRLQSLDDRKKQIDAEKSPETQLENFRELGLSKNPQAQSSGDFEDDRQLADTIVNVVAAIYSATNDEITVEAVLPYWMLGKRSATLPAVISACDKGYFTNENLICSSCTAGTFSSGGSVTECSKCPMGQVANAKLGATGCVDCLAGTAGLEVASTNCTVCPAGTYSTSVAATACLSCPQASYQSEGGQTSCTACGSNMFTLVKGASSASECICEEGFYRDSSNDPDAACIPCEDGMSCAAGSDMKNFQAWLDGGRPEEHDEFPELLPDYMSLSTDPLSVFKCTTASKCPGGEPGTCADGIEKDVTGCAYCQDGSYWSGEQCSTCGFGQRTVLLFPLLPICLSPIVFAILYQMASIASSSWGSWRYGMSAIAFLLLNHYQMISVINHSNVETSSSVGEMMENFDFANNPWSVFNTVCAGYRDMLVSMLLKVVAPLALLMLILITHFSTKLLEAMKLLSAAWNPDITVNVYFSLLFTFFAGVAAMSLEIFKCTNNPNDISTLSSDQSVICGSSDWWGLVLVAIVAVVLYIFGVGGLFAWVVVVAPRYFVVEAFRRRWGFMFYRFRPDVWWWGLFYIGKGIFTNLGYLFFREGIAQMYWVMLTLAVYSSCLTLFFPWRLRAVNALDVYTNTALIFESSLIAVYTSTQTEVSSSTTSGISAAIVSIGFSPFLIASLVATYILYAHLHPSSSKARASEIELLSKALESFATCDVQEKISFMERVDEWAQSYIMSALHIISSEFDGVSHKARLTDQGLLSKTSSRSMVDSKSASPAKSYFSTNSSNNNNNNNTNNSNNNNSNSGNDNNNHISSNSGTHSFVQRRVSGETATLPPVSLSPIEEPVTISDTDAACMPETVRSADDYCRSLWV